MYLAETTNGRKLWSTGTTTYQPRRYGSTRRPPAPPTSIALDDRFDQMTTEVPTEWNVGGGNGRDYEESISGYQNYVNEMEMMLGAQVDVEEERVRDSTASVTTRRVRRASPETCRSPLAGGGRRSLSGFASMDNIRQVHGRKASVDLVEHRILEDGPNRSISMWRERVARSNATEDSGRIPGDVRSETNSHAHRRLPSASSQARRAYGQEYGRPRAESLASVTSPRRGKEVTRNYERSEYMVMYQKPTKHGGIPSHLHPPSEVGFPRLGSKRSMVPSSPRIPKSNTRAISPTIRKTSGRSQQVRDKYVITYPNTPPYSQGSLPSSSNPKGPIVAQNHPSSPRPSRTYIPIEGVEDASALKATSTSSVELILASCEPSLLHIAPALEVLGITRLEHLRAINRLSDETRDKEVKEEALKQGVTVMEWAILVDKLQTL
ncbi:unnamed protein product [Somion occarium]|uniref:Uncharacterized protein n=1 Tax=Somion occarium TaxID=3059160 RepID=A0ABP1DWX4_9APHY